MSTEHRIKRKQSFKSRSFCFNTTQAEPTPNGSIENKLHCLLDVSMGEDASRKRARNSPQNFSVVFKTALTMLKKYKPRTDKKKQPSIKTKRKMGGWSDEHLIAMMGMDPT